MSYFRNLCTFLILAACAAVYGIYYVYETKVDGEILLENAPGVVKIVRESSTQILHVFGDDYAAIAYGQGFACAQSRLWQIEKMRRLGSGRLSEIFGKESLPIDEFMRTVGLRRTSEKTWKQGGDPVYTSTLQAFSDGVNDFVKGVSLTPSEQQTARVLPPEFFVFGISKETWEPWTPVDCILMVRLIQFHLTWNWASDLQREAMRQQHPDLEALVEEIMPFTGDRLHEMVTIIDEDDLKQFGMYSEESLVEKYRRAKDHVRSASPPLNDSRA